MASDLDRVASTSGLTDGEAREFQRIFVTSFIVFVAIAIVAHFLVWQWRPWLAPLEGYPAVKTGLLQGVGDAARFITSLV